LETSGEQLRRIQMSEETIPQMRERIEQLEKQNRDATKALSSLQTENRVLKARDIFQSQGFAPTGGELFAAQNPEGEITPEAVAAFVEKYALGKVEAVEPVTTDPNAEEGAAPPAAPGAAGLGALSRGGSRAGEGGAGGSGDTPMTRAEWQGLYARDPAAAKAAVASGRVQISKDNVYSGVRPDPGNPYAKAQDVSA
jgi:hypothetical protein